MKYRAVLLLILLVLLPLLLTGWLGYRLQQNEQQLVGMQLQKLIEQQLESVDQQLQTHFQQLERLLRRQASDLYQLADPDYSAEQLRRFVKSSAQVQQLFVLGADDQRHFPPRHQPLSLDEQRLVERLQPLWQSPGLFRPTDGDPVAALNQNESAPAAAAERQRLLAPALSGSADYFASGQLVQRAPAELSAPINDYAAKAESFTRRAPAAPAVSRSAERAESVESEAAAASIAATADIAVPETTASGWIAWYVDARLLHVFWWRDPAGRTLGFVLNDARLLSDLINRLPDAAAGSEALGDAQIRLLDSQGSPLYSWGQYQGKGPALRSLGLSHPLGSWSLEYHAPALQQAAAPLWLTLVAPLVLLGAGLAALGYGLYREQRRELELAAQRVNFVNQVSHELKTPLTNVRLYAEMLEQRLEGEEDAAVSRYLGVITNESQRLSRLIENVLSFARLQRQQLPPAPESADPDEQIERILGTFAPLLRQRGIEPRFEPGIGQCMHYDPATLEQILNNLLSNCEKYAPDSGELQLRSWREGTSLCVRVQDAGPGIDAADAARVFEPFYRSSSRLTDGITGTGIGLGLARDLARAHGGDLTLEASEQGARFLIRLEAER
ncbi:sensor histidine kinase [Marinobacterium sediminicola]|uniref:histidine kinase n=1 Tax=Marinobacterium sediminicola TaxID=518898 RepID=A0ABY1S4K5_9GAMM|nr:HAMP domain-containing sensor histidine kinase [Marinobacterium sediminicola]ULG68959.1 HAMP domain-containing histidine kinase [Marinobacterium sediminicola]SMR78461.1 His Kinase A (phospho-acceptor) domain-containing protein [Marinobacterium sediminicola]